MVSLIAGDDSRLPNERLISSDSFSGDLPEYSSSLVNCRVGERGVLAASVDDDLQRTRGGERAPVPFAKKL